VRRSPLGPVSTFLREAAASTRSPRANRRLAVLLALTAGMLNSVGFVAVGVYTSHMSGQVASAADHLVSGSWNVVGVAGAALGSFVLGAAVCAVVFNWGRRRHREARYANVLALEAVLIVVIAASAGRFADGYRVWVDIPLLCLTMGMQNAIVTKISNAQIRTTHVTGMVTDIGIELGKLAYRNRTPGLPPVTGDPDRLRLHLTVVGGFLLGGVLGASGYLALGFDCLLAPAVVLAAAAAPPILADRRPR